MMRGVVVTFALVLLGTGAQARSLEPSTRTDAEHHLHAAEVEWSSAQQGGPGAAGHYEWAAKHWIEAWKSEGLDACAEHRPRCREYGLLLVRAAEAFEEAGLIGHSLQVRKHVVRLEDDLEQPRLVAQAARDAGRAYRTLGMFEEAAKMLERSARAAPEAPQAEPALREACELWSRLRRFPELDDAIDTYRRDHALAHPGVLVELVAASLEARVGRDEWGAVLERAAELLDRSPPISTAERWRVDAIVARAHRARGRDEAARRLDRTIIAEFRRASAAHKRGPGLDGVAESMLREARRAGERARSRPRPGASARAIARWTQARTRRMETVAKKFEAIDALAPSPRWRVAAAMERALAWEALGEQVSVVQGERASHWPGRDKAREAHAACVARARALDHVDANARACELRLVVLDPSRASIELTAVTPRLSYPVPLQPPLRDPIDQPEPRLRAR